MATGETKVTLKGLVKYFGRFYSITVDDISKPTCERTLDILWNVCCHIYGEDFLLGIMRGKEKRICITRPLVYLFNLLLPKFQPRFTMGDLVYPTKERMVTFYAALMKFLKVWDAKVHIRESVNEELQVIQEREHELKTAIADAAESVHAAKEKRDRSIEMYKQLQDRFLTLETEGSQTGIKVSAMQSRVEEVKKTTLELKDKETDLKAAIKCSEERVDFLNANILPPKAEFEQKLRSMNDEMLHLQEQLNEKQLKNNDFSNKLYVLGKDKTSVATAISSLTETLRLRDKNRDELSECEEAIHSMEKPYRDVQAQISECRLQQERCSQSIQAETASLKQRLEELELYNSEQTIAIDDMLGEVDKAKTSIKQLHVEAQQIQSAMAASQAAYEKMLGTEEVNWKHLNMLKSHLRTSAAEE